MTYQEMNEAIREAELTVRRAETYLNQMARFLCGRLRKVNPDTLRNLKKELKKFNSQTGEILLRICQARCP